MKRLWFVFPVLVLFFSCSKTSKEKYEIVPKEIQSKALEFYSQSFNSGITIGFNTDSTYYKKSYVVSCVGGGSEYAIFGKYSKSGNKINLFPEKIISRIFKKGNTTDEITERPLDKKNQGTWLTEFQIAHAYSDSFDPPPTIYTDPTITEV